MCSVTNVGGLLKRGTRHVQLTNVRPFEKGRCWQSIDRRRSLSDGGADPGREGSEPRARSISVRLQTSAIRPARL